MFWYWLNQVVLQYWPLNDGCYTSTSKIRGALTFVLLSVFVPQPFIKKLVTITEMLTNHRSKYMNQ